MKSISTIIASSYYSILSNSISNPFCSYLYHSIHFYSYPSKLILFYPSLFHFILFIHFYSFPFSSILFYEIYLYIIRFIQLNSFPTCSIPFYLALFYFIQLYSILFSDIPLCTSLIHSV